MKRAPRSRNARCPTSRVAERVSERWIGMDEERRTDTWWLVSRMRCRRCGHEAIAVYEEGTPEQHLECSRCGAQDSLTRRIRHTDPAETVRIRDHKP